MTPESLTFHLAGIDNEDDIRDGHARFGNVGTSMPPWAGGVFGTLGICWDYQGPHGGSIDSVLRNSHRMTGAWTWINEPLRANTKHKDNVDFTLPA